MEAAGSIPAASTLARMGPSERTLKDSLPRVRPPTNLHFVAGGHSRFHCLLEGVQVFGQ